ncbi:MAG: sigma-54 interaction domain-containing protein [Anaerovoracaceae bacterium]
MLDTFGMSRVIEPKGAIPVTAWKIDNSKEINERELRISVKTIHIEKSSFDQICSECAYDDERIKAKVLDIIQKRGKLHNPFTDSGGMVHGKITEIGKNFHKLRPNLHIGDEVLCNTTTTAIPMYIEKIESIDYNYGELKVKGHAIFFENSPMFLRPTGLALNYTMTTLDEAGSIYAINRKVTPGMRIVILGKELISTMVYIAAVKEALGSDCYILVLMDNEACGSLSYKQIAPSILKYANDFKVVDVTNPIKTFEELIKNENDLMDFTINCEDLAGSEVLSVLLTKTKGELYFTSLRNAYSKAILAAESMGKEITTYSLDQYYEGYNAFTINLLSKMRHDLEAINRLYVGHKNLSQAGAKAIEQRNMSKTNRIDDFVFASPITKKLVDQVINIAHYDCNVIIQGETGVGKEKILELIHKNSTRRSNPCVKINCATIQDNLAESEFFGYEPGAFTGAQSGGKKGYFEIANNGILFLDEIGQLSPSLQSKLLRVIQEGNFYRIGGIKPINVNVRVICANNISLVRLVEEGKFREDLYYRLNICSIDVPPLRERRDDIICLAQTFVEKYNKRYGIYKNLTDSALRRLTQYEWPGNVRELENKMHRIVINSPGNIIDIADVDSIINEHIYSEMLPDINDSLGSSSGINFAEFIKSQEVKLLEHALKQEGSTRKAAAYLNMTQAQLMRKKQKYGL